MGRRPDPAALARIARAVRAGRACPLAGKGGRPVPGEGPADARVFVVGQAPGAEESRTGRPFVGLAGRARDEAPARGRVALSGRGPSTASSTCPGFRRRQV